MIAESQMKDSGIDLIEEIPRDWNKKRLKHIGHFYGGLTGKSGEDFRSEDNPKNKQFITFSNILNHTIISKNNFGNVVIDTNESQNKVEKNDIFFLMSSESYEDIGKSSLIAHEVGELYLNSFCKGYRLNTKSINPKFLNFQLMGSLHRSFIKVEGNGFTRINLRLEKVKDIPVFTPPLEEQKRISDYLDKKTQQIDELVQKTEKKIELLKEQRTALINHCVTKGLNPDAEMKDSGIEWIGEIPKHWGITKPKYQGNVLIGFSFDKDELVDENEGTLVLRSSNIQNNKLSYKDNIWVSKNVPDRFKVKEGDILICSRNGSRNLIGKNAILTKENENMTWGVFMTVYRTRYYKFFYWIFNSLVFKSQSGLFLTSTINQLTVNTLQNLKFPYVRCTKEQKQIADHLDQKTQQIDKLVEKEEKRISLLKEYRQSLISSAVTGKIRVTEAML